MMEYGFLQNSNFGQYFKCINLLSSLDEGCHGEVNSAHCEGLAKVDLLTLYLHTF